MSGNQVFVLLIIAIVMIASIVRSKYGSPRHRRSDGAIEGGDSAETLRLREEVKELKERLKVLERITVDKENSLSRQIDELRDR